MYCLVGEYIATHHRSRTLVKIYGTSTYLGGTREPYNVYGILRVYPGTYRCIVTPPWGAFPISIARQLGGCQYRTVRLRNALGEMIPTPTFLAPTLFQLLWRHRPWKIGPGGCDRVTG